MSLQMIHIKNYKSIREYKIKTKELNALLGENGSGKTNVLSALFYFYDNMISQKTSLDVFDRNNVLNDQIEISLTYDLSKLLMRSRKNRKNGKEKYVKYYNMIEGMSEDGKIVLTMSQVKGRKIIWNQSIDKRKIIYHLFPLYYLDSREINLGDWQKLWHEIGDLVKTSSEEKNILESEIRDILQQKGMHINDRMQLLDNVFENLQVRPKKFSVGEFSTNLAKIYYGGNDFSYPEHSLISYSNGTNSYNYITLLLAILKTMGKSKMKEPILLMDEPEISLHFHMVDELADTLFSCTDYISVIVATHSSRFIRKMLMNEENNCIIYQVYKRNNYSYLCLMNLFSKEEARERFFITEHHANAFFSKLLILVEGETEMELFNNSYLKILFPILKEADVIKGMSDKVIYRILDTTTRHYNVPMVTLLDMDKLLTWDKKNNKMTFTNEYNFIHKKEKYYYGKKRISTIPLRKRMNAMSEKCKFSYRLPFYSSTDETYKEFIRLIQEYYNTYNIFPLETTIEGTLINKYNYELVVEFLEYIGKWNFIEKGYNLLFHQNDKVNFIRILFNGKSDFLVKGKTIVQYDSNNKMYTQIKEALNYHIRKTSWVSHWLKFYFARQIGVDMEKMTENMFSKYCEDINSKRKLLSRFYVDFFELGKFINLINQI